MCYPGEFLLDCFEQEVDSFEHPFPIQADDPVAAAAAYQCLLNFSEGTNTPPPSLPSPPPPLFYP